jgi:hypothetical protein
MEPVAGPIRRGVGTPLGKHTKFGRPGDGRQGLPHQKQSIYMRLQRLPNGRPNIGRCRQGTRQIIVHCLVCDLVGDHVANNVWDKMLGRVRYERLMSLDLVNL